MSEPIESPTPPDRDDLTKLTVWLTPRALDALNKAAERLGDNRTDTVNRALALYSKVADLEVGDGLLFARRAGEPVRLARIPFEPRRSIFAWFRRVRSEAS